MIAVAAVVLVVLACVTRAREGSWLAPGALFCAYWAAWLIVAGLWRGNYPIPPVGAWFVVACALALVAGCELHRATAAPPGPARRAVLTVPSLLVGSGLLGGLTGLAATASTLGQSGYSLSDVTSQSALLRVGNAVSVQRYAGTATDVGLVSLLLGVTYFGTLAAPFLLVRPRAERPRLWLAAVLAPVTGAVLYSVLTTARLPMLLATAFTALAALAATSMRRGELVRLRARHVLAGVAVALAVGAAFVLIAFIRIGATGNGVGTAVFGGVKVYAIGGVSGFAQWLDGAVPSTVGDEAAPNSPTFGAATFGAVARQLGVDPQASRAYQVYVPLDQQHASETNIYTAFRSAIEDFGQPGALVFFAALGYVLTAAQRRAIRSGDPFAAVVWLGGFAYVLNMNSQSVFWFSNVWLAFVLAAGCLAVAVRRWGGAMPVRDRARR